MSFFILCSYLPNLLVLIYLSLGIWYNILVCIQNIQYRLFIFISSAYQSGCFVYWSALSFFCFIPDTVFEKIFWDSIRTRIRLSSSREDLYMCNCSAPGNNNNQRSPLLNSKHRHHLMLVFRLCEGCFPACHRDLCLWESSWNSTWMHSGVSGTTSGPEFQLCAHVLTSYSDSQRSLPLAKTWTHTWTNSRLISLTFCPLPNVLLNSSIHY